MFHGHHPPVPNIHPPLLRPTNSRAAAWLAGTSSRATFISSGSATLPIPSSLGRWHTSVRGSLFNFRPFTRRSAIMVAAASLFIFALLVSWARSSPVSTMAIAQPACPGGTRAIPVMTPLGMATGVQDGAGTRFAVKYGSAKRWATSSVATAWQLPNGASDPSALPLMCAQSGVDPSDYSEDCLSALIYVPSSVHVGSNVPTLMWIHGGSFDSGSATNPGLDGMNLAVATQSIVVVVQYRLGALGFLPPNGGTNLAVKDMVTCMQFLQKVLPSFGGSASKITLAGQSSGANMIRALLAAPSALPLFQSAILQSDPMDYGFLTASVQAEFQANFNTYLNCAPTDNTCLQAIPLASVLNASDTQFSVAMGIDPSATPSEPMRPVRDGSFITSTLDDQSTFPSVSKPILLTNVKDEAVPTIYTLVTDFMSREFYQEWVDGAYGEPKADNVLNSQFYTVPVLADGQTEDARVPLTVLGTDSIWRCPTWTFARNWAAHGGKAFVGLFTVGAHYPFNSDVSQCQQPGVVCHQDDIEIVFGTASSPGPAQNALTKEMQARYKAFLYTGNPNPSSGGYATWNPAGTSSVSALQLGSPGLVSVAACDPSFWGSQIPYDYQIWHD